VIEKFQWREPASNSLTKTAVAPEYASANARGRSPLSARSRHFICQPIGIKAKVPDGVEFIDEENGGGPGVRLRKACKLSHRIDRLIFWLQSAGQAGAGSAC